MTDTTRILQEHKIIGDVLPQDTKIPYNLGVHWPSVSLRSPAERLHRDDVQEQPTVTTNYKPEGGSKDEFVLLMVDPDLTHYNDQTFGQVRHWLVAKTAVTPSGDVDVTRGIAISPWVGPAPLAAHLVVGESRPARYTFLLLRHKAGASGGAAAAAAIDPASLRGEYEAGDVGRLGGDKQNIIDRMGFSTKAFIEKNALEVVAATFMFVEGNVKSSLANASLLATGVAQKAAGM